MTKTIGLTGGIGSGKSTVTDYLQSLNIPVIDTDLIAREVVEPGSSGLEQVVKYFGHDILNPDGSLNRRQLREIVFDNPQQKTQLESILHPLIQQQTEQQILEYQKQSNLIVVAIPLLIEAVLKNQRPAYLDEIWVIDCPPELQIDRASQRDQNSREQIQKIIDLQVSREQRLLYADKVIHNTGSIEHLYQEIDNILKTTLIE